jgi:diguanylate cyclase (GGDEF)-like protein/PAS domain S-box-containing protein
MRRLVLGGLLAMVVGHAAVYDLDVASWLYVVVAVTAVAAMAVAVWRVRPAPVGAWWLLVLGVAAWAVGDVWYVAASGAGDVPWVSGADAWYVASYLLLGAGVAGLVRRYTPERDIDALIDAGAVLVSGILAMWALVIEPSLADASTPALARGLGAGYAVADAVLVAGLVRAVLGRAGPSRPVLLLAGAATLVMLADLAYAVLVQSGAYDGTALLLDSVWLLGFVLYAAAALQPSTARGASEVGPVEPPPLRRLALTGGALLVPAPIAVLEALVSSENHATEYVVAWTVLACLVLLRLTRLARANERWQRELARREAFYERVARHSSDAWLVVRGDLTVLVASPAVAGLLGDGPEPLADGAMARFVTPHHLERALGAVAEVASDAGASTSVELQLQRTTGERGWFRVAATNLLDDPVVGGIVINLHDISERKRVEARLNHQAFHDALTGLANRALFHDRTGHALARLGRRGGTVAVLFCDLDGFKAVNDSLGHVGGDQLLVALARRFTAVVRQEDTVARLGGDEFGVLVEGEGAAERAEEVAQRLLDALQEPILVSGTLLAPRMSVGLALAESADATADGLLLDADIAMYRAKAAGKGRWMRFHDGMRDAVVDRLALESDLRRAVPDEQLELRFQPVIELASGDVTGFEALVRWRHPERGLLQPLSFIPLAEETGVIAELGAWVLRRACSEAAGWLPRAGRAAPTIAVNVSGRELADPAYPARVASALSGSGLDPARLVLEITETTLIEDPAAVAARLTDVKRLGVRIAIDDFGTGYSSLNHLHQLPVDILKIDKSFIEGVDSTGDLPPLVGGVLDLGQRLHLQLIAEGIERHQQHSRLVEVGCELGQGFLFAEPLRPDEARRLLAEVGEVPHPASDVSPA